MKLCIEFFYFSKENFEAQIFYLYNDWRGKIYNVEIITFWIRLILLVV